MVKWIVIFFVFDLVFVLFLSLFVVDLNLNPLHPRLSPTVVNTVTVQFVQEPRSTRVKIFLLHKVLWKIAIEYFWEKDSSYTLLYSILGLVQKTGFTWRLDFNSVFSERTYSINLSIVTVTTMEFSYFFFFSSIYKGSGGVLTSRIYSLVQLLQIPTGTVLSQIRCTKIYVSHEWSHLTGTTRKRTNMV